MQSNGAPRTSHRDTYIALVVCFFVALPLFVLLTIISSGVFILLPLLILAIGSLGAVNYLLWGRSLNRQVEGEREEAALRDELERELDINPGPGANDRRW